MPRKTQVYKINVAIMFWNEKVNDQRQDWRVWKAQIEIKAAIKNIWTYYSRSRQTVMPNNSPACGLLSNIFKLPGARVIILRRS